LKAAPQRGQPGDKMPGENIKQDIISRGDAAGEPHHSNKPNSNNNNKSKQQQQQAGVTTPARGVTGLSKDNRGVATGQTRPQGVGKNQDKEQADRSRPRESKSDRELSEGGGKIDQELRGVGGRSDQELRTGGGKSAASSKAAGGDRAGAAALATRDDRQMEEIRAAKHFNCTGRGPGLYADVNTGCKVSKRLYSARNFTSFETSLLYFL